MAERPDDKRLGELANKWLKGVLTDAELEEFDRWFHAQPDGPLEVAERFGIDAESQRERLYRQIATQAGLKPPGRSLWPRIAAAASIVLVLAVSGYYVLRNAPGQTGTTQLNRIKPGSNGAILTLADGRKIILEQTVAGKLAYQAGVSLNKSGDSLLVYQATGTSDGKVSYNILETPRGRQYAVILPDGTKVWLNASSSLKYPTAFQGKDRVVELTGQAWFSVAHNAAQPFRVEANGQVIEDIGTEFDVNAYQDEAAVRTTLLEGKARVTAGFSNSVILSPGQQAVSVKGALHVSAANTEEAAAWRNGYFRFNDESIESIMRKISRWYDITVDYQGELAVEGFNGAITRHSDIREVLAIMERSGSVHFKIEGRRVTVSR